jgi:hypothetical protein
MHSLFIPSLPPYKKRAIQVYLNYHKTDPILLEFRDFYFRALALGRLTRYSLNSRSRGGLRTGEGFLFYADVQKTQTLIGHTIY